MRSALNPATLRQGIGLTEIIDAASTAGFEGVELRTAAALEFAREHGLADLRSRLDGAGLAVAGIGYTAPLRSSPDDFERGLAELPAACELATALGAPGGTAVLPFRELPGQALSREETSERVGRLADVVAGHGLEVYLEFIGLHASDGIPWSKTLGQALDIAEAAGRPNVGVLIDSYHWHLGGTTTADLARIRPGTPLLLHINDAPAGAPATLDDSMRVLPGEGVLDLPAWLGAIRTATGYDGFVSIELFSAELRAEEPPVAAARAQRALATVLAQLES